MISFFGRGVRGREKSQKNVSVLFWECCAYDLATYLANVSPIWTFFLSIPFLVQLRGEGRGRGRGARRKDFKPGFEKKNEKKKEKTQGVRFFFV